MDWTKFNIETHLYRHTEFLKLLEEIRSNGGIAKYIEIVENSITRSGDLTYKRVKREFLAWIKENRYILSTCEKKLIK